MFYKGQYIHAFFQKGLQGSVRMPMGDCSFSLAITLTCRHTCRVCLKPVGTTSFSKQVRQKSHATGFAASADHDTRTHLVTLKLLSLECNTVCNNAGFHAPEWVGRQLNTVSYSKQPGPSQTPGNAHCFH